MLHILSTIVGLITKGAKIERAYGYILTDKLGKDKSDMQNLLSTFHNNIYAPLEEDKVIKYIGLINSGMGKGIRIEDIKEKKKSNRDMLF